MDQLTPDAVDVPRFRHAYEQLLDEIRKVPPADYIIINIDIPSAITTVMGVLPFFKSLRPRVVTELPQFDIARFDKMEAYTLALGHAHALYLAASQPTESLEAISETATDLRDVLFADAHALAQRRLIDGERLKELKGVKGYRQLAFDLFALAALMREGWATISGKTAIQLKELVQAEMLADSILTGVGQREQTPAVAAEAAENRQRAFTLFVSAYDHARRAVGFFHWDAENADDVAPSIYTAGRSARRKQIDDASPAAPLPAPQPLAPAAAAKPSVNGGPAKGPPAVGFPDSEPFVRE
ncbi:MAG TPA: hypothetical protein VK540_10075 [Polyangiaceae bacterium]|nr:hypothetical protein [Polyangiaceae bacterium]